jgi:preprotein translocase subunit SecE
MSQVTHFEDEGPREEEAKAARKSSRVEAEEEERRGFSVSLPGVAWVERIPQFLHDVRVEMRKVTWPSRSQVWSTTVVVVIAVIFFGFYLWGCDTLFAQFFNWLEKAVR